VVICDPVYAGLVNRIRLAGGVPRFVSCTPGPGGWATDPGELAAAIGPRTAAVLLMSPVMPTGAVLGGEHFDAIAGPVSRHRAWVIWDAAMERIRFDGQPPAHAGAHPGLAGRKKSWPTSAWPASPTWSARLASPSKPSPPP
jgi:aspartate/methionine/tyrosine aminotransferase